MINPVNHARTPEGAATYKVEPYVVAADVYALAPHTAAAAGPGTRARPAGCTVLSWNRCWVSSWKQTDFVSRRVCLPSGTSSRCATGIGETYYHIVVRRTEVEGGEEPGATRPNGRWRRASGPVRSSCRRSAGPPGRGARRFQKSGSATERRLMPRFLRVFKAPRQAALLILCSVPHRPAVEREDNLLKSGMRRRGSVLRNHTGNAAMTRLVQRLRSGPYIVTVGGEIKSHLRLRALGTLPFCDGTHQITKTERPGKLHWYDSAKQRHDAVDKYPGIRSDEPAQRTLSAKTAPLVYASAQPLTRARQRTLISGGLS